MWKGNATDPVCLFNILLLGHLLTYTVGIVECPGGKLLQYTELREGVHLVELYGLFIDSERVALGRFRDELASRILVEDF